MIWNRLKLMSLLKKYLLPCCVCVSVIYLLSLVVFNNTNGNTTIGVLLKRFRMSKGNGRETEKNRQAVLSKKSVVVAERPKAVVDAFRHAWGGYKRYAWGHDELLPVSKTYSTWFDIGLTIIDSLDTLYIMDLKEEFNEAREWVKNKLSFNIDHGVNVFEITIRALGGLLSAYTLTKDKLFLDKAIELGDRLLPAFKTDLPASHLNLATGEVTEPGKILAEMGTLQLEFTYLSRVSRNKTYWDAVEKVKWYLHRLPKKKGLAVTRFEMGEPKKDSVIRMGGGGDSYYEYLLKGWLFTGKLDEDVRKDYEASIEGTMSQLVQEAGQPKLTFVGELTNEIFEPKMEHLTCFLPGTLALGYKNGLPKWHMDLAIKLAHTCYEMYRTSKTGISPELAYFDLSRDAKSGIVIKHNDGDYSALRPEAIESFFYLYRFTKNTTYQDWGWEIFKSIEKYARIETGGYSSILHVNKPDNITYIDKMESFFLAETLKYLYLLFNDDHKLLPLDRYVFNTEAHPFAM